MKNGDSVQMNRFAVYSIKLPTDKFINVIENAKDEGRGDGFSVEVIKNPITGKKVHQLAQGYFFSLRVTYKHITKELINAKIFELKKKFSEEQTEKESVQTAKIHIFSCVPASSETLNIFYSPEKELLIVNKHSKNRRVALSSLIRTFGLGGFRGIVVLDDKLGLNPRL